MRINANIAFVFFLLGISPNVFSANFQEKKNAGNEYFNHGYFVNAISAYEVALDLAETSQERAVSYSNLGQCYRKLNDTASALKYFDLARELDPSFQKALYWAILLRLENSQDARDNSVEIETLLTSAGKYFPTEKLFRTLHARFEMLKTSNTVAPGVSYVTTILTEEEFSALQGIFKRATWGREKDGSRDKFEFAGDDKREFEELLGPLTQRLKDLGILPSGVKKFGFSMVGYAANGFMKQHKDHRGRVDHFVLGISLGGPCNLDLVLDQTSEMASLRLASNSVFIMEGDAHDKCTHGISHVEDERFSLLLYVPAATDRTEMFDVETKKLVRTEPAQCDCDFHKLLRLIELLQEIKFGS